MSLFRSRQFDVNKVLPFANQAIVSGSNFIVGIMLARFLGIEAYGLFALGWLVVLFASSVQLALILNPLYTLAPKLKANSIKDFRSSVILLQLGFCCLTLLVSFITASLIQHYVLDNKAPELYASILPFTATVFVLYDYIRRSMYLDGFIGRVIFSDLVVYGMQIPFFFFANKLGYLDLSSALIVITGLFSAGVLINVSKLQFHLPALSSIRKHYQEIWGFSKFLVATSVLQWLSGNYFILIAGATLGPISVGAIRVAQNIMGILHVIFLALENVIPIKAASVYQKSDLEGLITYFKREGGKWLLIVISLIIPVAIFSPQIIKLFYGDQYDEYSWILSSYSGIYILIFIGVLLRFFIRTIEANRIIFTAYVLNTLFSLCMANYMLDNYQVQGLLIGLYSIQLITLLVMATMIKLELK